MSNCISELKISYRFQPGSVRLLDRRGPQAGVLGRFGVIVVAHIGIGLVDGDGGEIEVVLDEARNEIFALLRGRTDLEPVSYNFV